MAKIAQVVADGKPGGGTTAVLALSGLLATAGHRVTVIGQSGSYLMQEARRRGLAIHELDFTRRSASLSLGLALGRWFRHAAPDIVHAHGARAGLPVMLASRLLARTCAYKLFYTVHGFHFLAKRAPIRQLARAVEAYCIGQAHTTVFVSDGDRRTAAVEGLLKHSRAAVTIKNAVQVDVVPPADGPTVDLAFLGRLTFQKNPLLLADILAALQPQRPSLSVIGGGPLGPDLATRLETLGVASQVTLHGECDRETALALASRCRLLVLPSRWEGHPIALVEAMLLGLPVVASKVSGNDEIVIEGQTGHLVAADDAAGYAQAISRLLADPANLNRMRHNALQTAAAEYRPQRVLEAHARVYGLTASGRDGVAAQAVVKVCS